MQFLDYDEMWNVCFGSSLTQLQISLEWEIHLKPEIVEISSSSSV